MRFVWTVEAVPDDDLAQPTPLTREALSKSIRCHINTIYNYEKLVKEWVDDAKKYYEDENGDELKWVELNPYLAWLILKVWKLHKQQKSRKRRERVEKYLLKNPDEFSEKEFENYVRHYQQTKGVSAA